MLKRWFQRMTGAAATPVDPTLDGWRARAGLAARDGSAEDVQAVLSERVALQLADEETEIDQERLQARLDVIALEARLETGDLPRLQTQHKAAGTEACVFLAPAVLCTDEGDWPGKFFVTEQGIRFAGGGSLALRWSAVQAVTTVERDLLVSTRGSERPRRFRCNTFSDAAVAARLVEWLRRTAPSRATSD